MPRLSPLWLAVPLALLVAGLLAACSPGELDFSVSDLPPGDAQHGAELFTRPVEDAASCASCHSLDGRSSAGPSLEGYPSSAGRRVNGQSAEQYTFEALLRPSKHLVQGFSNLMPGNYSDLLSRHEIADLIAYLLAL